MHHVGPVAAGPRSYSVEHSHTVTELNLILPIGSLVFDITLDDERYVVEGPASVHIPPGVRHSANVRSGYGFFVAIIPGIEDYTSSFNTKRAAQPE